MGYPYNYLIAPAILLDNPGLTREEFIEKLDATHSTYFRKYKPEEPWEYYDKKYEDRVYHDGLEGLAKILRLPDSEELITFQQPKYDENGFLIKAPRYFYFSSFLGGESKQSVIIHEKNIIEESRRLKCCLGKKLEVGSIWEETQGGDEIGMVTKIYSEEKIAEEEGYCETGLKWEYDLDIRPFHSIEREETFQSKEELFSAWPQFHPDRAVDWSKVSGQFKISPRDKDKFFWKKVDGKYYLDERTFESIPASFRSGGLGYTDLLLTAGAVKHKAWKILSRKGLIHFEDFIKDFPDVKQRYEKGIWDSHTSLYSKAAKMSHFDLIRMRLESRIHS